MKSSSDFSSYLPLALTAWIFALASLISSNLDIFKILNSELRVLSS